MQGHCQTLMAQDLAHPFQVPSLAEDRGRRVMAERVRADLAGHPCSHGPVVEDVPPAAAGQAAALAVAEQEILRPGIRAPRQPSPETLGRFRAEEADTVLAALSTPDIERACSKVHVLDTEAQSPFRFAERGSLGGAMRDAGFRQVEESTAPFQPDFLDHRRTSGATLWRCHRRSNRSSMGFPKSSGVAPSMRCWKLSETTTTVDMLRTPRSSCWRRGLASQERCGDRDSVSR